MDLKRALTGEQTIYVKKKNELRNKSFPIPLCGRKVYNLGGCLNKQRTNPISVQCSLNQMETYFVLKANNYHVNSHKRWEYFRNP